MSFELGLEVRDFHFDSGKRPEVHGSQGYWQEISQFGHGAEVHGSQGHTEVFEQGVGVLEVQQRYGVRDSQTGWEQKSEDQAEN